MFKSLLKNQIFQKLLLAFLVFALGASIALFLSVSMEKPIPPALLFLAILGGSFLLNLIVIENSGIVLTILTYASETIGLVVGLQASTFIIDMMWRMQQ